MKRISSTIKTGIVLWLLLSLIPLAYYFHLTEKAHQFLTSRLELEGLQLLSFVDSKAKRTYAQTQQIFYELSHSELLHDFSITREPNFRKYIESQWYLTAFNSTLFYQLRFIDNRGNEVIRVDYMPNMANPYIVPSDSLQNKSHRDYFMYAQKLANGEQGHFGIDLEYEHSKPVIPYKPSFRIIYPIVANSVRQGYFIANLDVLAIIDQITANTENRSIDFINEQGEYVISSDRSKLFSDIVQDRAHFNLAKQNEDVWDAIISSSSTGNSLLSDQGLYVFRSFNSQLFGSVEPLTMLTLYPTSTITSLLTVRLRQLRTEAITIWLCLGIISTEVVVFIICLVILYRHKKELVHGFYT